MKEKEPPLSETALNNPSGSLSVSVLCSGSRGNATYVSDGRTAILVDAGLSGVQIQKKMADKGLDPNDLDGIVVSHEHRDHIQGVGVLSRRFGIPVYINDGTMQATGTTLGKLSEVVPFFCGRLFSIGTLSIHPFSISHDAGDPAGFTIGSNGVKIGMVTDLGIVTNVVKSHLTGCEILILEANHDPQMLIEGPYPWPLKQRIQGRSGHLSNAEAAILLKELWHDNLSHVILAHLSEENNTPEKAIQSIERVSKGSHVKIHIASQASGCCVLTAG